MTPSYPLAALLICVFSIIPGCRREDKESREAATQVRTVTVFDAGALWDAAANAPAKNTAVSRKDCAEILEKADQLIGHTRARDPRKHEREVDECVAAATPEMLDCARRAQTAEQLMACEPAHD